MKVTPAWVDDKLRTKLAEPIIREQIDTAVKVYAEAREVMANLHDRQDNASGCMTQSQETPKYRHRNNVE
jgi:predicted methyltransferase MtxX (methanogen marker protein 4)